MTAPTFTRGELATIEDALAARRDEFRILANELAARSPNGYGCQKLRELATQCQQLRKRIEVSL